MKANLTIINDKITLECIKKEFPILNKKHKGKPLIYLDSAATSQNLKE